LAEPESPRCCYKKLHSQQTKRIKRQRPSPHIYTSRYLLCPRRKRSARLKQLLAFILSSPALSMFTRANHLLFFQRSLISILPRLHPHILHLVLPNRSLSRGMVLLNGASTHYNPCLNPNLKGLVLGKSLLSIAV